MAQPRSRRIRQRQGEFGRDGDAARGIAAAGDSRLRRRIGPFADPARARDAALLLDLACDAETLVFTWTPHPDRLELYPAPSGSLAALAGVASVGGATGLGECVHPGDRSAAARAVVSLVRRRCASASFRVRLRTARETWTAVDVRARRSTGRGAPSILGVLRSSGQNDREQIGTLAARLMLAEENERQRIAEGLHDDLGQNLAVLRAELRHLQTQSRPNDAEADLPLLIELIDRAIASTRSLTFELSSPILHRLGLAAAIRDALDKVAHEHGVDVALDTVGELGRLPVALETLVHRCVQELLRNAVRHARAQSVTVVLRRGARELEVTVSDDGAGFDAGERIGWVSAEGGFGLVSIERALEHVSGRFSIESAPGLGTRATFAVPVRERP